MQRNPPIAIAGSRRAWAAAMWAAALFVGCGQDRRGYVDHSETLFPIEGVVLVDGKPAANATVVLHRPENSLGRPSAKEAAQHQPDPRGDCDENGAFKIYTYAAYDGAPVGDYPVTVSWRDAEGLNREGDNYPELLPARFQTISGSGLKATVVAGENPPLKVDIDTRKKAAPTNAFAG